MLERIVAQTDGVPLFVEELTKAVLEGAGQTSAVTSTLPVPSTLQASLMARLDRLPAAKQVAQIGAVIGREFSYDLLMAVAELPEVTLTRGLDDLVGAGLAFRRGMAPEATYVFKHALVQDAAYKSLLKFQRQQLHARIARVLEERFPETVDARPDLLAQHCTEAGLAEQAVSYWQRAGQQALAHFAMAEAITHLTKGLEVLQGLPGGPERQWRELGLQLALGQASTAAKGFAASETGRAYAQARKLCCELGDDVAELFPILYGQSVFHFQRGELAVAHEVARELLHSAEKKSEAAARVTGHRMVGSTLCQLGSLVESREHFETALTLYDPMRDRTSAFIYAIDSRVMCLSWLSHVLVLLGYPEQALARHSEVSVYARELAHPVTVAVAFAWGCIFHQLLRDGQNAREQAEAVVALATEQGYPLYGAAGMVIRGWALADSGQVEDGIAEIRRGLAAYRATEGEMWLPYFLGLLAEAEGRAGQAAAGLSLAEDAVDRANRTGARWIEAELYRVRGDLLLGLSEPERRKAEACFSQALAIAREQGSKMWELRAATSLARLWRDQERLAEAHNLLAPIYDWFTEGFDATALKDAKALLGA
jgi:predicted ATPase